MSENPEELVRSLTTSELVEMADHFHAMNAPSWRRQSRAWRITLDRTLDVIDAEIERRSQEAEARAHTLP